ncbi:unnamed protein product [Lepeophtheirus salmonis]|uniref:(salmon louse) hypothetical protein n=1 Tax=Lepeophtheirus salmonis TaxID=72036 RepID=A0A817FB27_LEPSM|nr:unnamed protein product [Lepeophtheirus salmonis]CAG9476489.1 unnamed protein product [Lepeophtheirus salmonis]
MTAKLLFSQTFFKFEPSFKNNGISSSSHFFIICVIVSKFEWSKRPNVPQRTCTNVDYGNTLWCVQHPYFRMVMPKAMELAPITVKILPLKQQLKVLQKKLVIPHTKNVPMWTMEVPCGVPLHYILMENTTVYGICDLNSCKDVGTGTGVTTAYIVISPL